MHGIFKIVCTFLPEFKTKNFHLYNNEWHGMPKHHLYLKNSTFVRALQLIKL